MKFSIKQHHRCDSQDILFRGLRWYFGWLYKVVLEKQFCHVQILAQGISGLNCFMRTVNTKYVPWDTPISCRAWRGMSTVSLIFSTFSVHCMQEGTKNLLAATEQSLAAFPLLYFTSGPGDCTGIGENSFCCAAQVAKGLCIPQPGMKNFGVPHLCTTKMFSADYWEKSKSDHR